MNYYNEYDKFAAAWLRELIKAGHVAPGEVDERSILEVKPSELAGYTQCHFFAGIGVWSYALRKSGWPDGRPVWTGSCPCQPFSTAGQRKGTQDERHLWPTWFRLIRECKPVAVFGEQVEAAIRQGWLDLVQTDLEGIGYTVGAVGFPACGFGAPHIRQRLYFVADSKQHERGQVRSDAGRSTEGSGAEGLEQRSLHGGVSELADSANVRSLEQRDAAPTSLQGERPERTGEHSGPEQIRKLSRGLERLRGTGNAGNPDNEGPQGRELLPEGSHKRIVGAASVVNGFWRDAEWIYCRDEKYRAVEPGTFPLAHGAANRVGRLRGYGNALVAPCAEAFIKAFLLSETEL